MGYFFYGTQEGNIVMLTNNNFKDPMFILNMPEKITLGILEDVVKRLKKATVFYKTKKEAGKK